MLPPGETALQFDKIVIPGEHPASVFAEASPDRPRDLTGMRNCDTASDGESSRGRKGRNSFGVEP